MSKRKNEHISISEALQEFVDKNNLQKGLDKVEVKEIWLKLMGNGVASYTTSVNLERNTLYVALSSSVLKEELSFGKSKIIEMINTELGKDCIKKLIFR